MYAFTKTKILENQPNWCNRTGLEGDVVVQGLSVFIVQSNTDGECEPGEPVLTYSVALGKWVDDRGEQWDEWTVEYDEMGF